MSALPAVALAFVVILYAAAEPFFGLPPAVDDAGFTLSSAHHPEPVRITAFDRTAEPDVLTDYALYR